MIHDFDGRVVNVRGLVDPCGIHTVIPGMFARLPMPWTRASDCDGCARMRESSIVLQVAVRTHAVGHTSLAIGGVCYVGWWIHLA